MSHTNYSQLTNDELIRLVPVDNTLSPAALVAIDRLTAALEEIDALSVELDLRVAGPGDI